MDKEKFLNIQNKLPQAIAYYSQNIDDEILFFGPKHNLFFADYLNSKKFLSERIKKDVNLLTHFDEKSLNKSKLEKDYAYLKKDGSLKDGISQLKEIVKLELDYFLYANYALELMHGENLYKFTAPFNDDTVKYILKHRKDNFDKYKKIFEYYSRAVRKNTINISEEKIIKSVVKNVLGNAIVADEKMLLDKKLQNKLAYEIKKYPLTEKAYHVGKDNFDYYVKYYVGKYKNQFILFSEVVSISKKENNKKQEYSYQLNLALNGDVNRNRILYRIDCNSSKKHLNKMEGEGFNISNDKDLIVDVLRRKNVMPCHIHTPNNKYAIIFPNHIHSCDSKNYDFKFKSYDQFVSFNRDLIKTEADSNVSKKICDLLKNDKTASKENLNSFLKESFKKEKILEK